MSTSSFPLLKQLATQTWNHEQVYEKVDDEESNDEFPGGKPGRKTFLGIKIRSLVSGVVIIGLIAVCITGIVWWPSRIVAAQLAAYNDSHPSSHSAHEHSEQFSNTDYSLSSVPTSDTVATCGSTLEEAQALNCVWDGLGGYWVPPACYDKEITEQFLAAGPWKYFNDHAGTQELAEEDLKYRFGEENKYYTTLKYHRVHCSFQWRKMHRALEKGWKVENMLMDYHHTLHCGTVSLQEGQMDDILTSITIELATC